MTPSRWTPGSDSDDPVLGWLRTLPAVPPTLVSDVMRQVPTTPQRRHRGGWSPRRLFRRSLVARPAMGGLRLLVTGAAVLAAVLIVRALWPVARADQLAADHGILLSVSVEPGVVQVLRDDAGHDLMATWPDHPRDIDRLAVGPDGAVWISSTAHGTDNAHLVGAHVWRLGAAGLWGGADGVPESVSDTAIAPDGTVWVAGTTLSSFRGDTWLPAGIPGPDSVVRRIAVTGDAGVWVAGDERGRHGLWQLTGGTWRDRSVDAVLGPMLAANTARAMATTADGTAWVGLVADEGGGGAGLLRDAGDGWQLVRPLGTEGEDASHDVFALSTGPDGSLWAFLDSPFFRTASDYRLARWDGQLWRSWTDGEGFPADATPWTAATSPMRVAPDGTVWLTRDGGGLVRFDGTHSTRYLQGIGVNDFDIAPDGTVWVASERRGDGVGGVYAILP